MSEFTDRRFMLRYDDDGGVREPFGRYHRDDYFMIGVVISGQHRLSIDFDEHELQAGDAVIVSPGQVHASHNGGSGDGFVLVISPELLTDNDLHAIRELRLSHRLIKIEDNDLRDIIRLYEILKRRNGNAGETEQSIVAAIKSIVIGSIKPYDVAIPGRYIRLATRFQQMMEQHIRTVKSPSEYASMLNVSGVYLNEAVKSVTGRSVSNLIGEYITMLAKRGLGYTQLSAQEIALNLGYEDYSYFSRLFRHYAGMSPKAFRAKYLE